MKKYYYKNEKGEMVLARKSKSDKVYKYALIYKEDGVWSCSSKLETLEQQLNYYTKGFGYTMKEKPKLWSSQFFDPKDFKIVELIIQ